MKEISVRDLREKLLEFEQDAIVLICDWDQQSKFGYNYTCIAEVVDEQDSFSQLKSQVKILTRDGEIVSHLKLRGEGKRFVVLQ